LHLLCQRKKRAIRGFIPKEQRNSCANRPRGAQLLRGTARGQRRPQHESQRQQLLRHCRRGKLLQQPQTRTGCVGVSSPRAPTPGSRSLNGSKFLITGSGSTAPWATNPLWTLNNTSTKKSPCPTHSHYVHQIRARSLVTLSWIAQRLQMRRQAAETTDSILPLAKRNVGMKRNEETNKTPLRLAVKLAVTG